MKKILRRTFKISIIGLTLSGICGLAVIFYLSSQLPDVETLKDVQLQVPLKIYSSDGKLIAEYGEKRRTPLELSEIPEKLIYAVIATEDHRFYQHPGVDLRGLARAAVSLITKGTKEQGGSTITMQVARNFFLSRKKTYMRKINEILLALKIEKELSKHEILELYLNKIYLGKRAYGVAAAAEVYYGTTVDQLTLAQMATIAGLPQAPSAINPLNSPTNSIRRRNHVLDRMIAYNLITASEYEEAISEPVTAKYHSRQIELHAPYVAEMARQYMIDNYGNEAYEAGYEIITTVDSEMQNAANFAIQKALLEYDSRHEYRGIVGKINDISLEALDDIPIIHSLVPAVVTEINEKFHTVLTKLNTEEVVEINNLKLEPGDIIYISKIINNKWQLSQIPEIEGAIVALNPDSGEILSLVGGFNFEKSRFNRATQAERQPGSSFKPFIYGAALENGFTPASIINDAPIVQSDPVAESEWRPQNHTKQFYGPTRLRVGLTKSRNLVSIRLLQAIGLQKAKEFITACGIDPSTLPNGLSLALGTNHLSPLELAEAYSVFPNGGHKIQAHLIEKIIDYHDNVIYASNHPRVCGYDCDEDLIAAEQVISEQTAYLVTSMLQDVIKSGTGSSAKRLGRNDLAGKTGTTNDQVDGWFSGYTRDIVVTSWVGFDEPRTLKEYAVKAALPMWIYFMETALRSKPEHHLIPPSDIVSVRIDPKTGLLAKPGQQDAIFEQFTTNTAPTKISSINAKSQDETTDLLDVDTLF